MLREKRLLMLQVGRIPPLLKLKKKCISALMTVNLLLNSQSIRRPLEALWANKSYYSISKSQAYLAKATDPMKEGRPLQPRSAQWLKVGIVLWTILVPIWFWKKPINRYSKPVRSHSKTIIPRSYYRASTKVSSQYRSLTSKAHW